LAQRGLLDNLLLDAHAVLEQAARTAEEQAVESGEERRGRDRKSVV
jgi:hypothetical protein